MLNGRWFSGDVGRGRYSRSLSALDCGSAVFIPADATAQPAEGRPWLGVAMDADEAGQGVRVGHVIRGSPADKAGLREGDRILKVAADRVLRRAAEPVVRAVSVCAVRSRSISRSFVRGRASAHVTLPRCHRRTTCFAWTSSERLRRRGRFRIRQRKLPPSIAAMRRRVVLLDFWATWCGPCRVVIPKLGALQARYGAQGLSVLGVSTEDARDVALFAQRMAVPYAVAVDKHAQTTRSYGVMSLPTLVMIDKRGVVRDVAIGYDSSEDARLESSVRSLLAEPPPTD